MGISHGFDSHKFDQQTTTPPDEAGWRLVETAKSFCDEAAKATSRPVGRSDFSGGEQCSPKSRLRPPSVPDGVSIPCNYNQQTETPPDEAGWRFCLLVEPGGIEPPSASPLQAALHT
jgi:hypothetical protein